MVTSKQRGPAVLALPWHKQGGVGMAVMLPGSRAGSEASSPALLRVQRSQGTSRSPILADGISGFQSHHFSEFRPKGGGQR